MKNVLEYLFAVEIWKQYLILAGFSMSWSDLTNQILLNVFHWHNEILLCLYLKCFSEEKCCSEYLYVPECVILVTYKKHWNPHLKREVSYYAQVDEETLNNTLNKVKCIWIGILFLMCGLVKKKGFQVLFYFQFLR